MCARCRCLGDGSSTPFANWLRTLGKVEGDWDVFEVATKHTTEEVLAQLDHEVMLAPVEPWAEPTFSPGEEARIATSDGEVLIHAEGWSDECERATSGGTRGMTAAGRRAIRDWKARLRLELGRGWRVVVSEPFDEDKRLTLLVLSKP